MEEHIISDELSAQMKELIERAEALPMTMRELCEEAAISTSTFTKWKASERKPTHYKYLKFKNTIERLERLLVSSG